MISLSQIDLNTITKLSKEIPRGIIKLCESGIKNNTQVRRFSKEGADGFLVGESLMVSNNIKKQTVELIKK